MKAKQMPVTTNKLHHVLKTKHPYIERNLGSVVSIIRHSVQNAAAFEAVVEHLKKVRKEAVRLCKSVRLIRLKLSMYTLVNFLVYEIILITFKTLPCPIIVVHL